MINYKIGSNPFIDEVLDDIWSNKNYPVPHVQRLEVELCQDKISEIEGRMELAKKWNWSKKIREHLEREKKRYEKKIEQTGNGLFVNPGEICGYLSGEHSIGIYDTETGEAKFEVW